MSETKHLSIAEFRRLGYLQEVNRRVLHPCGLALEVTVADDGSETISGVWDYRDDPEGIIYSGSLSVDPVKVSIVDAEWKRHALARAKLLGNGDTVQQPP